MANAIDILIQSRNEAIQSLRETRRELANLRSDLPSLQGAAIGAREALEGVGAGFLEIARAGSAQGEDLSGLFERIAAGGAEGEAALTEFAEVAGRVAPAAAQQLAADLETATAATLAMAQAAGGASVTEQDVARALEEGAGAAFGLAEASSEAAAAQRDEAQAAEAAGASAQAKGGAEDRAAEGTRRHTQASRDQAAALRGARQGVDAVTQSLGQMVPGLQGVLQPLRQAEGLLFGLGGTAAGIGLAATAVAAVGAAAVLMGKSLADDVEKLQNLENATGASIPNLQVLRQVLTDAGLSADAATFPLTNLNRAIATGDPLLKALGVSARDPVEALLQLSDAFRTSNDEGLKTEISVRLLGGRSRELLAVMDELRERFGSTAAAMEDTGAAIRLGVIPAANEMDQAVEDLGKQWVGAWNDMRAATLPSGIAIVKSITELIDATRNLGEVPAFKFLLEQSRTAKDGVAADLDATQAKIRAVLQEDLRRDLDRPDRARERSFFDPTRGLIEGPSVGLVGPPVPPEVEEGNKRLRDALDATSEAAKKQASEIAELGRVLGVTNAEAAGFLQTLEAIEKADQAASVLEQIAIAEGGVSAELDKVARAAGLAGIQLDALIGPEVPQEIEEANEKLADLNAEMEELARLTGLSPEVVKGLIEAREEADATREAFERIGQLPPIEFRRRERERETERRRTEIHDPEALDQVKDDWTLVTEEVTSAAGVMDEALGAVFNGLQSGFGQVFQGLLSDAQTFKGAMTALFRAMVSEILAALARLAAAAIFKTLLKLVTGGAAGPIIDSPIGTGGGGNFASATPALAPTSSLDELTEAIEEFSATLSRDLVQVTRALPRFPTAVTVAQSSAAFASPSPSAPQFASFDRVGRTLDAVADRLVTLERGMEKLARAPVTVNVTALDAKSVEQMFNSPLGSGLAAQRAAGRGGSW